MRVYLTVVYCSKIILIWILISIFFIVYVYPLECCSEYSSCFLQRSVASECDVVTQGGADSNSLLSDANQEQQWTKIYNSQCSRALGSSTQISPVSLRTGSSSGGLHNLTSMHHRQTVAGEAGRSTVHRSPESRAVQAVSPFGVREPNMPTSIPDECQLVREAVSGQWNSYASTSTSSIGSGNTSLNIVSSASSTNSNLYRTPEHALPPSYASIFASTSPSGETTGKDQAVKKTSLSQPDVSRAPYPLLMSTSTNEISAKSNLCQQLVMHLKVSGQEDSAVSNYYSSRHHSEPPSSYLGAREVTTSASDIAGGSESNKLLKDEQIDSNNSDDAVSTKMIQMLKDENRYLRLELEGYIKKTFKLQQLELQYQKIYREYEEFVRRQDKREQLEQQMRSRMQLEISRLKDVNLQLQDQLENTLHQISYYQAEEIEDSELRHEITRRDMMIAQLITQNKELLATKERQAIELDAQRVTLEEQRTHIQILDKALTNAQEKVLKSEEVMKKKQSYMQKADELQRALHALQEGMRKREENHKRVKAELEKELAYMKIQKKENLQMKSTSRSLQDLENTISTLRKELQEKEEQILNAQTELVHWQEAYYVELKKQEAAFSEASDSKDARIRVLEKNSEKAEKLIETSQSETKRFLDDLRMAKGKIGEMETKIQQLEALLAEKEAMINVLRRRQQLSTDPDAAGSDSNALATTATTTTTYSEVSSLDNSKQRLEAVRRRLLQSPSPSRCYARLYQKHNKFISVDSSFNFDDLDQPARYTSSLGRPMRTTPRSALRSKSSTRTQASCDAFSPASPLLDLQQHLKQQRHIYTLPTRRKATDLLTSSQRDRPRSADDHLLSEGTSLKNYQTESATIIPGLRKNVKAEKSNNNSTRSYAAFDKKSSSSPDDASDEELWNVIFISTQKNAVTNNFPIILHVIFRPIFVTAVIVVIAVADRAAFGSE
ncbi:Angiomotin [Trichinella spiralis]|uniref:Angiomotin n=1 Tax=Trichinella spiralis TaxID=6334 RepID=A0ABR3K0A6_TRISP